VSGGGAFLIRSLNPEQLFTREDLSDEQRLFGQTAAEFMRQEVLPNEASLYAHDWVKTRELLKKMLKSLIHDGDMYGIVTTGTSSVSQQLTYDKQILESAITRITGNALLGQIPALQKKQYVASADNAVALSMSLPSPLSVQTAVTEFLPKIVSALNGTPAQ